MFRYDAKGLVLAGKINRLTNSIDWSVKDKILDNYFIISRKLSTIIFVTLEGPFTYKYIVKNKMNVFIVTVNF